MLILLFLVVLFLIMPVLFVYPVHGSQDANKLTLIIILQSAV